MNSEPKDTMTTQSVAVEPHGPEASSAASRQAWNPSRQRLFTRLALFGILLVQALLSARTISTADDDEALYIRSGHILWNGVQHGVATTHWGMHTYFSGAPELYPVLAGWIDSALGLTGVRAFSLLCMLSATALLYLATRRLFGVRVALWTAVMYAVLPTVLELNVLATYDAPAVALLSLAVWIVVRSDKSQAYLLAAPVVTLAVGVKYASLIFLPAIAGLAALAALRRCGRWNWWAASRVLVLPTLVVAFLGAALHVFGTAHLDGLRSTTTNRVQSVDTARTVFDVSLQLGGLMFFTACLGAFLYARLDATEATPGRWWRICYGILLCGTALVIPAYQAHLHTTTALGKHIAYALLFAAPLAGIAIDRFIGPYVPNLFLYLVGAGIVALAVQGTIKATELSRWYPDTTQLMQSLKGRVTPDGKYLVDPNNPPKYYLAGQTRPEQWTELTWIDYTDPEGQKRVGLEAYLDAIANGYFDLAVLNDHEGHDMSLRLIPELEKSGKYRLLETIPNEDNGGRGEFQIWGRK
ncbi:glycosyltransferase family 39 protein [Streptomyces sp. ISL-66]|uniref:ArnT family glycosyltransferase n=1 Tax=Streptomyces sp. ISL-66 TaxID=2819186 RepID=UPI001BE5FD5F|nr:glycosyltransferase family 39 protein [Streptomyces sp. ISL-66]MBT2469812.1 glycosyltransferase family 39 protein [Streptomyces sp. ISL-66]